MKLLNLLGFGVCFFNALAGGEGDRAVKLPPSIFSQDLPGVRSVSSIGYNIEFYGERTVFLTSHPQNVDPLPGTMEAIEELASLPTKLFSKVLSVPKFKSKEFFDHGFWFLTLINGSNFKFSDKNFSFMTFSYIYSMILRFYLLDDENSENIERGLDLIRATDFQPLFFGSLKVTSVSISDSVFSFSILKEEGVQKEKLDSNSSFGNLNASSLENVKIFQINCGSSNRLKASAEIAKRNFEISLHKEKDIFKNNNHSIGIFINKKTFSKFSSLDEMYEFYLKNLLSEKHFLNLDLNKRFIDIPFDEIVSESEITLCAYLEVASKDLPISRSDEIQEGVFPPDIFHNLFALLTVKVAFSNNS